MDKQRVRERGVTGRGGWRTKKKSQRVMERGERTGEEEGLFKRKRRKKKISL